jgi:hypothetical protein
MPITEHLWNEDHFLQSGRDFELGTLMVLLFLCMVLVLSRQCKQCVEAILSIRRQFTGRVTHAMCLPGRISASGPHFVEVSETDRFTFPLLI